MLELDNVIILDLEGANIGKSEQVLSYYGFIIYSAKHNYIFHTEQGRIKYDYSHLKDDHYKTFNYIKKRYPHVFEFGVKCSIGLDSDTVRDRIIELSEKYKCRIFSKGIGMESRFLGFSPLNLDNMGVRKFDDIYEKGKILGLSKSIAKCSVEELCKIDLNKHLPVLESLYFFTELNGFPDTDADFKDFQDISYFNLETHNGF